MANVDELLSSLISDIHSYTDKDPLLPWLRYSSIPTLFLCFPPHFSVYSFIPNVTRSAIRKIKDTLPPKILKEKLPAFLQKCAHTFELDRRYRNDMRYIRVWLHLVTPSCRNGFGKWSLKFLFFILLFDLSTFKIYIKFKQRGIDMVCDFLPCRWIFRVIQKHFWVPWRLIALEQNVLNSTKRMLFTTKRSRTTMKQRECTIWEWRSKLCSVIVFDCCLEYMSGDKTYLQWVDMVPWLLPSAVTHIRCSTNYF